MLASLRTYANVCQTCGSKAFVFLKTSFTRSTMLLPMTAVFLYTNSPRSFHSTPLCFFLHGFRHTIHEIFFYRDFLLWHGVRFILNLNVVCARLFCDYNTYWFLPPFIGQIVVPTQNLIIQCYLFSFL